MAKVKMARKTLEQNVNDLIEIVVEIKENMATKADIKDMATKSDIKDMATKGDIRGMVTKEDIKDMATKSDIKRLEGRLDVFENKMLVELRAINNELEEVKARLARLEKITKEDADAVAKEVVYLRKRVDVLERQVKQLQTAR